MKIKDIVKMPEHLEVEVIEDWPEHLMYTEHVRGADPPPVSPTRKHENRQVEAEVSSPDAIWDACFGSENGT